MSSKTVDSAKTKRSHDVPIPLGKRKAPAEEESENFNNSIGIMMFAGCGCNPNCFMKLCDRPHNYMHAINTIKKCMITSRSASRLEFRQHLVSRLKKLETSTGERIFYTYSINNDIEDIIVCKKAWLLCHGATDHALKRAKEEISQDLNSFNGLRKNEKSRDIVAIMNTKITKSAISLLERREIMNNVNIPCSDASVMVN